MVIGVPEQAVVECCLVLLGMVDVNIHRMPCRVLGQAMPARISGSEKTHERAVDEVILVVVVRHERAGSFVQHGFMVSVQVTEVAPAVLVYQLTLGLKGVGPLHDRLDVAQISRVAIAACGDEASHYG